MTQDLKILPSAFILLVSCIRLYASTESITAGIETYFRELRADVAACAQSSILTSNVPPGQVNAYFSKTIKKHQTLNALFKINAKGIVVNEYVRSEKPLKKKRTVSKQPWYSRVVKTQKDVNCLVREKNGRYYLYWSSPLFRKVSGAQRFDGVVTAKIDVWDCFYKLASTSPESFLIRLNGTTLYAHLWENKRIFVEDRLAVPGIEKISVRYQKSGVSPIAVPQAKEPDITAPAAITRTVSQISSIIPNSTNASTLAVGNKRMKNNIPIIIGLIIIILIVLTLLVMQVIGRLRPAKRSWSMDNDDRFQIR